MESAILFMLIAFMFGFLLTGVAMTSHLRVNLNETIFNRELEIEQIGENFVSMNETDFATYIENFGGKYTATVDLQNENKTLVLKKNNSVVLYIELDSQQNVKVWKYSND